MTKMIVLIKTSQVGYRSQPETIVNISFKTITKKNDFLPELLGDESLDVVFDQFSVLGLESLVEDLTKDVDLCMSISKHKMTLEHFILDHLKGLVKQYILEGDTLKAGAGILGKHQLVYQNDANNEAFKEMRRCETWHMQRVQNV